MKTSSLIILAIAATLGFLEGFFLGWPGVLLSLPTGFAGGLLAAWNNNRYP